ncbi:MAG TPA: isoprenylcysteine carboxylmethyltransferase family protein [Chitinophagaceae bacterium]
MTVDSSTFAAVFFFLYLAVVFVWPSVRTYRQTGINPLTFGPSDSAHDFTGRCFKVLLAAMILTIAASWSHERLYPYLLPASFLSAPFARWCGILLCSAALLWTAVAQHQMGVSWRIGIDEHHKTALHTGGLYSLSRNPVFLGLLTALLGLFMLLPNALTLVYLVAGYLLIAIQVRLEEEHLLRQHGAVYEHYKARVRRFV